jgi:predicted O-methyltransferase YrrM
MNPWYWLRRPYKIPARIRYWMWERRNRDKPWLTPGAVEFCAANLRPHMIGVEFGSGRSTAWFARQLARLTSVEHDPDWYARVKADLDRAGLANVDYRFIAAEPPGMPTDRPRYAAVLDEFPDDSLDLMIVDGHYRDACIQLAPQKLRPGGFLLIDDVGFWPQGAPVPPGWRQVHDSTNGIKNTALWQKPAPGGG